MKKKFLISVHSLAFSLLIMLTTLLLSNCSSQIAEHSSTVTEAEANPLISHENPEVIWSELQQTSSSRLMAMKTRDPIENAWVQLALINKRNSQNTQQLTRELFIWRQQNPNHPGNQLFPDNETLKQVAQNKPPQHIALLLPQSGPYAVSGQMVREGFLKAYYANPAKAAEQTIKFYDTNTASMNALSQQAVAEGAEFIVGPLTKENVQQLIGTTPPKLPILALNYTEGPLPTHFYEFGLRPEDESAQMAKKARQAGYSKALIIAPQNAWGNRIAPNFASSWQTLGGNVKDTFYFTPQSALNQEVARLLTARKGQADFDVIFLFAQPTASRKIVPLLRQHLLNPNTPIYASASVYSGNPNSIKDKNLNGIIICDIPWRKNTGQSARLFAVGKDAYLLSKNMPQLVQLPHFAIYGNTGALSLTSQQQVHRSLPCRAFANGLLS